MNKKQIKIQTYIRIYTRFLLCIICCILINPAFTHIVVYAQQQEINQQCVETAKEIEYLQNCIQLELNQIYIEAIKTELESNQIQTIDTITIPDVNMNFDPIAIPVIELEADDQNHITKQSGTFNGPSGRETYYNLPMNNIIETMRNQGYLESDGWVYWVREDGAKMFGDYIMVAANLNIRPRGTILECSLGQAIVCDTGEFATTNQEQLDIAVDW